MIVVGRAVYQFMVYMENLFNRFDICTISYSRISNRNIDHHSKKVCTVSYYPKFVISYHNLIHYMFNFVCKMRE